MNINWSTFFLEIVNFLVLVWLLKRFFYKPLRNMLEQRRQTIETQLQEAHQIRVEAEKIQTLYENRQAQWESEKQQARLELQTQLDEEKQRQLNGIIESIAQEKEKNRVAMEKQLQQLQQEKEQQALYQGAQFVSKLMQNFESSVIENKLIEMLLLSLEKMPEIQKRTLRDLFLEEPVPVKISTAKPVNEQTMQRLNEKISSVVEHKVSCEFQIQTQLIAGIRINLGPYVLRANLEDELQYFYESGNGFNG